MASLTEVLADINGVDYDARAGRILRMIEDKCEESRGSAERKSG